MTALAACGSGGPDHQPADHEPPACTFPYPPPEGYLAHDRLEVPVADHVGVRQVLVDGNDRSVILTSGIPGEFGEGLPVVGQLPLSSGVTGSLAGEGRTWVLRWGDEPPCTPLTVTGNGFDRGAFRELMIGMGLVNRGTD